MDENYVPLKETFYFKSLDLLKNNHIAFSGLLLLMVAVFSGLMTIDISIALFFPIACIGLLVIVFLYHNPIYIVITYLITSFLFFFFLIRILNITNIPFGFVLDGLNVFLIVVLLIKRQFTGFKTQIGSLILIWVALSFVEIGNPFAASRVAWFHAMRVVFNSFVPFFIFYSIFQTGKPAVKPILICWIVLSSLSALYTLYQELVELPPWDYRFIHSSPMRAELCYTFGRLRKLSFFENPTANGLVLCSNAIICFGLVFTDTMRKRYKILLAILALLSAWAMTYTGTRTATLLFILGIIFFIILRRNRILWIGTLIIGLLLTVYIVKTGGGAAMSVMTTAFDSEDPSLQARFFNQQRLRVYLYRSPIGYGLGSTGYLGTKFSPHTFLGSFPPDSELVKVIIEVGFLGAAFYLYMYYVYMKRATNLVIHRSDPFTENFRIIVVVMILVILIGHYPQQIMSPNPFKTLVGFLTAYISLDPKVGELQKWSLR